MIPMLPFLIRSFFAFTQVSQTYYVSPNGNDTNDGTSPAKAWKSIEKVNQIALKAGNKGLFEGGKTFYGTLQYFSTAPISKISCWKTIILN